MKSITETLKAVTDLCHHSGQSRRKRRGNSDQSFTFETLQPRQLLATLAVNSGDWNDPNTWDNGVPDQTQRAIVASGIEVQLDGTNHFAQELVVHGELVVPEDADVDKSLTSRWVHINSGGVFSVGSEADRFDEGDFTLNLTGTDVLADHSIQTNVGGNSGTINVMNNDGFLMTAGGGRIQFFGADKLSFTKLSATAQAGDNTIVVENIIERNYDKGQTVDGAFVTSAGDDGLVNWEVDDQIVIASSSYDYAEEDVRTITAIVDNGDGTSSLTLDRALDFRHYGEIEAYGGTTAAGTTAASQTYEIDLRAEVALLSRNVKVQGLASQDTDVEFGDRANAVEQDRLRADGLSDAEFAIAPDNQIANGIGGHIMFMPTSGQITVDGVQLDGLGQASQKGRYPIHWHLGDDRSGDVLRNSSVTNSNNRGVTIHGTSNLTVEGVVLHDIHGHGFFFEDAVETGNELVSNIAFGIHKVGGNNRNSTQEGFNDPFIVDTHDSVHEADSRFRSSAAFWITNPDNTFVGNISAGGVGTGFWYVLPRTALGVSGTKAIYDDVVPIFAEFGQFDNNASHSTPIGLNFDRGEDLENGNLDDELRTSVSANVYSPREGGTEDGDQTVNFVNGFTSYKATGSAVYHRGSAETISYNDLRIADSFNAAWSVFETEYVNSLYVGHSRGNADLDAEVGGPRFYDGAGLHTNAHFAGFADDDAYTFQVEGGSFGPTMYHAFRQTSFEDDGTYGNISHAVSDFQQDSADGHDLGRPSKWIKAALDLDGTLTGAVGGGAGYTIVPEIEFLADADDSQPAGWRAFLSNDIYARIRVENNNDGVNLFDNDDENSTLIRFIAPDGDAIDVISGQNNGQRSWAQIVFKSSEASQFIEDSLTIEFLRDGLPTGGFVLDLTNQDGGRPAFVPEIQDRVDSARMVLKIVGAGNYTPDRGTEVATEAELRSETNEIVYFRDEFGNLFLNTAINEDDRRISLLPGDPLQTAYEDQTRTIEYGTTIEAEQFDHGLDGIAYHDNDAINTLGSFRDDTGVDVTETKVGQIEDGEWLEYSATIVEGGYSIGLNVMSTSAGGQIRVLAASSNSAGFLGEVGAIVVPDTEGEFSTLWIDGADLSFAAGPDSVIRLEFVGGGFELDSIEFAPPTQTAFVADRVTAADLGTTRIELEQFDNGGQGVAYFDTTPGNLTNDDFREDQDVDANDKLVTGNVRDGEWLEYTTDIEGGLYDITLNKAWGTDGQRVKLFVGESNSTSELIELGQFELGSGETVGGRELITLENIDLANWAGTDRVFRIEIDGNFMGLDYLDFESKTQVDLTAPQIESVVINDGSDQRSIVSQVTVTFSELVSGVDATSFILNKNTTNTEAVPTVATQVLNGKTVATLTFAGVGTNEISLADGNYSLTTLAERITDAAGNLLDGNGDGTAGDNATDSFFRLFGDIDGDRDVDRRDLLLFRRAFNSNNTDAAFSAAFDADGDGDIDRRDLLFFSRNFNTSLVE